MFGYRFSRFLSQFTLLFFIGVMMSVGLVSSQTAFAQDAPITLPDATPSANEGIVSTLTKRTAAPDVSRLKNVANRRGQVRVLVSLVIPEGAQAFDTLNDVDRAQVIAQSRSSVLASVAGHNVAVQREYEYFPLVALRVDAASLDALAASPHVAHIERDALHAPDLDLSATQVQADGPDGAWERGRTGSGWAVAILDTGVNKNHTNLVGRVISEACYSDNLCPGGAASSTASNSGLDCSSGITGCGHGSHVAGIVASTHATNRGIAYNANIIAIKVFSSVSGSDCTSFGLSSPCALTYSSDYIAGLNRVFALRNTYNIAAANMSLGGGKWTSQATCDADNAAIQTAIQTLRNETIGVAVSSGNSGYSNGMGRPACVSAATSVGSVDSSDNVAGSSNAANFLDLLAPGVSIYSVNASGGFTNKSGTSMAAPHVAAAFAILKQADSGATVAEMEAALKGNGLLITDPKIGLNFPRIRLSMALDDFMPPTAPDTITATANSQSKITVLWENVTGETGYTLQYRPSTTGTYTSLPSSVLTVKAHTGLICGTKYYYRVYASNSNGNSGYSPTASATTEACSPPTGLVATTGRLFGSPVVVVEWNSVAGNAGYKLQRYTGIPIIVIPKNKDSKALIGLIGWKTVFEAGPDDEVGAEAVPCQVNYTYRVITVGNDVNSAPSSSVSIDTTDCIDEENLLVNGGFEINADGDAILPDNWTKFGPFKQDQVISDPAAARTGSNAVRFVGKPKDKSGIKQVVDLTSRTFAQGDKLRFSGYLHRKEAPEGLLVMRLNVLYQDKTTQKIDLKLKSGRLLDKYYLYASSLTMTQGTVKKIAVTLQYKTTSGKLTFDNVALVHELPATLQMTASEILSMLDGGAFEPTSSVNAKGKVRLFNKVEIPADGAGTNLIPLPAAPTDLRGN